MAEKIKLKRSSILGKRPSNYNLEPGELGLNTNSEDPGAFFEVSDGNVVKIGPTAVSQEPPVSSPQKGESWFNLGNGSLEMGTVEEAKKVWRSIAAPFLGGGGTCVFVAPEFKYASDKISNNGESLPFKTLNRAILELTKVYLSKVLAGFPPESQSGRYTIYLAPSLIIVNNDRGVSETDFDVDFSSNFSKEPEYVDLVKFNPESGGLLVPFGISIQGMDLKKSVISPSYVPSYRNFNFPAGLAGNDQPISSVLKCSGNVYASNFSCIDKVSKSYVASVKESSSYALFKTDRPHGLSYNDLVSISLSPSINQQTGALSSGQYYCAPVDPFTFYLASESLEGATPTEYIPISDIPDTQGVDGPLLTVSVSLKSAHRLRLFSNSTQSEIASYYTKVQKAFSQFFGGRVSQDLSLINEGDYVIVAPTSSPYPNNEEANTVANSSLYANQVNLRSEYGMCWGDFDGSQMEGFKSIVVNSCTAVAVQKDPEVFEIYTTLTDNSGSVLQKWWSLTEASYLTTPQGERPDNLTLVPKRQQLDLLNSTPLGNIRYYYDCIKDPESGKSLGIVDIEKDYRHFGFRVRNGAYAQLQSIYTIGVAVGVWALNGGICNLTNSTSNFGSVSFKSEGFLGVNSIGGANDNSKGYVLEGVKRPLEIDKSQAESPNNKIYLSLGSKIKDVKLDSNNPNIQLLELETGFSPSHILPFSLKPGTAIWVDSEFCTYRGFFAEDGGPTVDFSQVEGTPVTYLRLRAYDSTIPNSNELEETFGIPYIRRFLDPRTDFDKSYTLQVKSTFPYSVAPQVGAVLRLNQTSQQLGSSTLKPNVQLDPGSTGGWGKVFTIDAVETLNLSNAPQFNYVIGDSNQDLSYNIVVSVTDYSRPWVQGKQFKKAAGTYTTHKFKNWYCAENDMWETLYYGDASTFSSEIGPFSLSPFQPSSAFVDTSPLEKQEPITSTFQGEYASDPYLSQYLPGSTYFRGSTVPYSMFGGGNFYDGDDGSEDLGLCRKIDSSVSQETSMVTNSTIYQTELLPVSATSSVTGVRYRPAIIEFSVLTPAFIPNPKQTVSILKLTSANGARYEYVRVIFMNGTLIRAVRLNSNNSFYPFSLPSAGSNYAWPQGTSVKVCTSEQYPFPGIYDPDWSISKDALFRFFRVMGYNYSVMQPLLKPKSWGERLLPMSSLSSVIPNNGYAISSGQWPLEFNQPSTIIANTHTWAYAGYYNYSRGLLKYQSSDISRKLAADFQATATWGGRVTVTGINDKGEIVMFGPQRQALTSRYYDSKTPVNSSLSKVTYEQQPYLEFPAQVLAFSTDNIEEQFDGTTTTFDLTRAGEGIPAALLSANSLFVVLGGVIQKPIVEGQGDYTILNNRIVFVEPPPEGANCHIRVVTTGDSNRTLVVVPLEIQEEINGSLNQFTLKTQGVPIRYLDINSDNTFVILGGTQQLPQLSSGDTTWSYTLGRISRTELQIIFSEPLPEGIKVDIRSFCSSSYWATQDVYPVRVYSLDPLIFDGGTTNFELTYNGQKVNPNVVNQDNLIVNLGGVLQTPGESYTVNNGRIIFPSGSDAPGPETNINLRAIVSSDYIGCPYRNKNTVKFIEGNSGIVVNLEDIIDNLDL